MTHGPDREGFYIWRGNLTEPERSDVYRYTSHSLVSLRATRARTCALCSGARVINPIGLTCPALDFATKTRYALRSRRFGVLAKSLQRGTERKKNVHFFFAMQAQQNRAKQKNLSARFNPMYPEIFLSRRFCPAWFIVVVSFTS